MSTALFYACKKQDAYVRHTTDEMAAKLYLTESFIRFSGNFITDFYLFADYLRVPAKQNDRSAFLTVLKDAAADETALENHLVRYHLSLDEWINRKNKLDNDLLRVEPGFSEQIDSPGGVITVHLARFMILDPPHQIMHNCDCRMRTLPELRGRPPAEMELLRRAYVKVMEG